MAPQEEKHPILYTLSSMPILYKLLSYPPTEVIQFVYCLTRGELYKTGGPSSKIIQVCVFIILKITSH